MCKNRRKIRTKSGTIRNFIGWKSSPAVHDYRGWIGNTKSRKPAVGTNQSSLGLMPTKRHGCIGWYSGDVMLNGWNELSKLFSLNLQLSVLATCIWYAEIERRRCLQLHLRDIAFSFERCGLAWSHDMFCMHSFHCVEYLIMTPEFTNKTDVSGLCDETMNADTI